MTRQEKAQAKRERRAVRPDASRYARTNVERDLGPVDRYWKRRQRDAVAQGLRQGERDWKLAGIFRRLGWLPPLADELEAAS